MKADLHVHSCFSSQSGTLRFLRSRDCYSSPAEVYATARRRGMDAVTITDHDSIGGCLAFLDAHPDAPDFFVSEEISCVFAGTTLEVHLGAYGMTEALHRDVQSLRGNVFEAAAFLRHAGVIVALNHLLFFYRGQVPLGDYLRLIDAVDAVEARNGTMLPAHNELVSELIGARAAEGRTISAIGGSDAHTLRRIGRTWTEAPGTTVAEFLGSLKEGLGTQVGADGSVMSVTGDVYGVVSRFVMSLLVGEPRDHHGLGRAGRLAFVAASLPMQWLPLALAWQSKRREADQVGRAVAALSQSEAHRRSTALEAWR
jgi:predicted metal-dependent phosphoesterase TrpH